MHEKDCLVFVLNLLTDHFAGCTVILKRWERAANHLYYTVLLFILEKRLLCKDSTEAKKNISGQILSLYSSSSIYLAIFAFCLSSSSLWDGVTRSAYSIQDAISNTDLYSYPSVYLDCCWTLGYHFKKTTHNGSSIFFLGEAQHCTGIQCCFSLCATLHWSFASYHPIFKTPIILACYAVC